MSEDLREAPHVLHRSGAALALSTALVVSAWVTAAALWTPGGHWLGWLSFLPLFVVVRRLRPVAAALAGGMWGTSLCLLSLASPTRAAEVLACVPGSAVWLLTAFVVIPAVYIGLAASLTKPRPEPPRLRSALGPSMLLLAIGWTLVEAMLHFYRVFGPRDGLLTSTYTDAPTFHWSVRLLGYVCSALLVACANASLATILSLALQNIPICRSFAGFAEGHDETTPSLAVAAPADWFVRLSYPRGPP